MDIKRLLGLLLVILITAQIALAHSAQLPLTVATIAGDAGSGKSSVATQGGQKLIEDSFGMFIAVYRDISGRVAVTYANSNPGLASSWAAPVKAGAASQYRTPAAVLVSPTSLRIIVEEGSGPGKIKDLPVTIQRDPQSNIVGVSFGSTTTLDGSGKAEFPAAILAHNGDIIAVWSWHDTSSSSRVLAFRWKTGVDWTSLTGSGGTPDSAIVDTSNRRQIIPNLVQRPDNRHIYLVGNMDEDSSSKNLVFNKATFDGSNWSWGSQKLAYETNAARGMPDTPSLAWDPTRNLVVTAYDISGTTHYGVFTLNAQDQKVHIDTPSLKMGNNEWGTIAVDPATGDYYVFTIDTTTASRANGKLGYTWRSGGTWKTSLTMIDSDTDNVATSLRRAGNSPFFDLLYENTGNLKLARLALTGGTSDTSPPTQPQGLTAIAVSGTRIDLSWEPSTDNVAVAGYDIYRDGSYRATVGGATTIYSDNSVSPGTTYTYTVVAFDAQGNRSPPSAPATATTPAGGLLTLAPSDDASIIAGSPTTNFGLSSTLKADTDSLQNFLVKFTVTGVSSSQVVSAKLRLFNVNPSSVGGVFYRAANNTWMESTVSWDNAPAADLTPLASLGPVSTNTWYEVDMTSLITGDGVYSLRVTSTSSDGADYSSKEGANAPQLILTLA